MNNSPLRVKARRQFIAMGQILASEQMISESS